MCTLTWWREDDRYGVRFNRDESVRRSVALPPSIREAEGCRYICPVDPDGGGTWIWVNETGVVACVLNNYTAIENSPAGPISRGILLSSLAPAVSVSGLERRMERVDCGRYRGFFLFGCDGENTVLFSWDGAALTKQPAPSCPVTTSGFLPAEVTAYRVKQYRDQVTDGSGPLPQKLASYHQTHAPDFPAHSVLMARPDARTVSLSAIVVARDHIADGRLRVVT